MKKFLITLLVSLAIIFMVQHFAFGQPVRELPNVLTNRSYRIDMANSMGIVGIIMFYISLISITNASRAFISIGFAVKSIFVRYRRKYSDYYDYAEKKREERGESSIGFYSLFISIVYIIVALWLDPF